MKTKIDRALRDNRSVRQLKRAIATSEGNIRPIKKAAVDRHRRGKRGHESSSFAR
jgi:hypothetical protein